jgi:transcriptional regulator with XRE-family HTH domain
MEDKDQDLPQAEIMDRIGHLLKAKREEHALTQTELAERLGLSQSNIARMEQGKQWPRDFQILLRLAEFLGLSPDTLAARIDAERTMAEDLRRLIEKKGFTQADVARGTDIDPGLLNRAIARKSRLSEKDAKNIATFLGIEFDEIVTCIDVTISEGHSSRVIAATPDEIQAIIDGSASLTDLAIFRIKRFAEDQGWNKNRLSTASGVGWTTIRFIDEPDWAPAADTLRRLECCVPADYVPSEMLLWLQARSIQPGSAEQPSPQRTAPVSSNAYWPTAIQAALELIANQRIGVKPKDQAAAIVFFSGWYAKQVEQGRQPRELTVSHAKALLELGGLRSPAEG